MNTKMKLKLKRMFGKKGVVRIARQVEVNRKKKTMKRKLNQYEYIDKLR